MFCLVIGLKVGRTSVTGQGLVFHLEQLDTDPSTREHLFEVHNCFWQDADHHNRRAV